MTAYVQCPKCGSPVYDNREEQAQGLKLKWPQFKCTSKTCGWYVYLDGGTGTRRLAVSEDAGTRDYPPDCRTCGEPWDWQSVWLWKQGDAGGPLVCERRERFLVRHAAGRPCARFNAAHQWGDGPQPAARALPPRSDPDTVKARWREAFRAAEARQRDQAA